MNNSRSVTLMSEEEVISRMKFKKLSNQILSSKTIIQTNSNHINPVPPSLCSSHCHIPRQVLSLSGHHHHPEMARSRRPDTSSSETSRPHLHPTMTKDFVIGTRPRSSRRNGIGEVENSRLNQLKKTSQSDVTRTRRTNHRRRRVHDLDVREPISVISRTKRLGFMENLASNYRCY